MPPPSSRSSAQTSNTIPDPSTVPAAHPAQKPPSALHRTPSAPPPPGSPVQSKPAPAASPQPPPPPQNPPRPRHQPPRPPRPPVPRGQRNPPPAASPEPPPPLHSPSYSQFTRFLVRENLNRSHPLQPLSIHHGSPKHRIAPEHIRRHRHRCQPRSPRRPKIVHLRHILRHHAHRPTYLPIH